jgi:hypothetical protein
MERAGLDAGVTQRDERTLTSGEVNETYCPACLDAHPRAVCAELTRGNG